MTAVNPTDRPKSVRNRCVIKILVAFFYVVTLRFGFFCGCRGFCHRTESDLFFFRFSFLNSTLTALQENVGILISSDLTLSHISVEETPILIYYSNEGAVRFDWSSIVLSWKLKTGTRL